MPNEEYEGKIFHLGGVSMLASLVRTLLSKGRSTVSIADLTRLKEVHLKQTGIDQEEFENLMDRTIIEDLPDLPNPKENN